MKLNLTHRFDAPRETVMRVLSSGEYAAYLAQHHSFFAEIRVLEQAEQHGTIARAVRYRARPFITRLGIFSLPASWFVWVEQSRFDLTRGLLTFENVPEVTSVRGKLVNRGSMQFLAEPCQDGSLQTLRQSSFELAFELPAVYRPLAELGLGLVAKQLVSSLDEEARLLGSFLRCQRVEREAAAA